jgi:crooked neck
LDVQAQERQEAPFKAPKQKITDFEELNEYRGRKRKEFEDRIRYSRTAIKGVFRERRSH